MIVYSNDNINGILKQCVAGPKALKRDKSLDRSWLSSWKQCLLRSEGTFGQQQHLLLVPGEEYLPRH